MSFRTLTRQSDAGGAQRAMVKFNRTRRCFHIDLYDERADQPWLIMAVDHRTGDVLAAAHGQRKEDAWALVAEALGIKA